jgi:hypothetical protein
LRPEPITCRGDFFRALPSFSLFLTLCFLHRRAIGRDRKLQRERKFQQFPLTLNRFAGRLGFSDF